MTLAELRESAPGDSRPQLTLVEWDGPWRAILIDNLAILVGQLWWVGSERIFVDGSFVEEKPHPHDIDGYFECNVFDFVSGRLERALNALDPQRIWGWDHRERIYDPDSGKAQLPMWHRYYVELYPHYGQPAGILDRYGNQMQFPSAFRQTRLTYRQKGIVQVVR